MADAHTYTREELNEMPFAEARKLFPNPTCPHCGAAGTYRDGTPGLISAGIDFACSATWDESPGSHFKGQPTNGCVERLQAKVWLSLKLARECASFIPESEKPRLEKLLQQVENG